MLDSDVKALDNLLASEMVFTNHLGQISDKQDDLAAHESGKFKIEVLNSCDRHILNETKDNYSSTPKSFNTYTKSLNCSLVNFLIFKY